MSIRVAEDVPAFDADAWVPKGRERFRLDELAKFLQVSVQHLFNLRAELRISEAAIKGASSRDSILVDRKAVVAFLKRRSSLVRKRGKR